jgi:hypothetical protein
MRRASALLRALPAAAVVAALGVSTVPAQAQGFMYVRDVRAAVGSAYVFRGAQMSDEMIKLTGELRLNGLHAGATLIQPVDTDDFANETRVFGGWSPHLEDHGSPLDFELGFTWYATPDTAPGFPDADRFEPYAKLFFNAPLMPSIASYYDTERETYTLEGRLTHFVPFGSLNGLELGFDGGLVSPDGADDHTYAQGSIELVRNFLGGVEGYVGVRGAVSSEDRYFDSVSPAGPIFDQSGKVWATAGFSASF